MSKEFFDEEQGAAVLKHGVLRRYLPIYARMTGSTSAGGRVAYLDGYAGTGAYDNGTPGSPILAVQTAEALAANRQVITFMVEKDFGRYQELSRNVARAERCTVRQGPVQEHVDEFLGVARGCPVLAFLDPFGLLVPMEDIARIMNRKETTEVLLTFQLAGIRRNAGKLQTTSTNERYLKARDTILENVDASLGGDWWRRVWEQKEGDERMRSILDGYISRLQRACGTPGYWAVPVRDRWGGPAVYFLILLTRSRDGLWHFHESLSLANEDFYAFTHREDQFAMFDERPEARAREWIDHIKQNILLLLEEESRFTTRGEVERVFGDALGLARTTHVRTAVKELHAEGIVLWNGKGDVPDAYISRMP